MKKTTQISQMIRKRCMAAISQKYEEALREEAVRRLDWELLALDRTGGECLLFYIRKLMDKFQLRACDISTRGRWGGSIIVYLMDISEIDPICYHLSSEFVFGIEGERDLLPEINIQPDLWEDMMVDVNELESVKDIIDMGNVGSFDDHYFKKKLNSLELIPYKLVDELHRMSEMTGVDIADVPLDDREVYEFLWEQDGIKQAGGFEKLPEELFYGLQEVTEYLKPKNVEELARVLALTHEPVYWMRIAEKQVAEKTASFETLISCREDKDDTEVYLCPKAHAISDAIVHIRLAWYRIHYPQVGE